MGTIDLSTVAFTCTVQIPSVRFGHHYENVENIESILIAFRTTFFAEEKTLVRHL